VLGELKGHEDGVRMVLFDPSGKAMYSCGDDCTFRIWQ
jgi:WD40 repeat protein